MSAQSQTSGVSGRRAAAPARLRRSVRAGERRQVAALVDAGHRLGQPGERARTASEAFSSGATGAASRGPARQPAQRVVATAAGACRRTAWCSASALYVAMSTPVGQSRAQPLQDRQRSSASRDGGVGQPVDERAVERLLEHPGAAAGGVLLVAGREVRRAHHAARSGVVGQALADPGAAVHGVAERAAVVDQPQRGADRGDRHAPGAGRRPAAPGRRARPG